MNNINIWNLNRQLMITNNDDVIVHLFINLFLLLFKKILFIFDSVTRHRPLEKNNIIKYFVFNEYVIRIEKKMQK